jgi:hypothetical protein
MSSISRSRRRWSPCGLTMLAHIGVMRALNRHVERPAEGDAKSALIEQIGCNGACLWDELVTGAL